MNTTIISLGGSLVYPKEFDVNYVAKFNAAILDHVKKGSKFAIYCGGGYLARQLQKKYSWLTFKYLLDWVGIYATRENAKLLQKHLKLDIHPKIITNPNKKFDFKEEVILGAGWKPGWSTDYDAVLLAKNIGAKEVINLSNIDYLYDKDPKKFPDAKPIKSISWDDFRKIVGNEWKPGLNMPFDPIAAAEAQKSGIKVIIAGPDIKNLKKILENQEFEGTVVE